MGVILVRRSFILTSRPTPPPPEKVQVLLENNWMGYGVDLFSIFPSEFVTCPRFIAPTNKWPTNGPPITKSLPFSSFKERLQAALLGPRFGGVNDARRDKFLMNESVRDAGLAAVRQVKTGDRSKVQHFLSTLKPGAPPPPPARGARAEAPAAAAADNAGGADVDASSAEESGVASTDATDAPGGNTCGLGTPSSARKTGRQEEERGGAEVLSVVKPSRGCASGSVFRCRGEDEAMEAFENIVGTPKYGTPGEFNHEVMDHGVMGLYLSFGSVWLAVRTRGHYLCIVYTSSLSGDDRHETIFVTTAVFLVLGSFRELKTAFQVQSAKTSTFERLKITDLCRPIPLAAPVFENPDQMAFFLWGCYQHDVVWEEASVGHILHSRLENVHGEILHAWHCLGMNNPSIVCVGTQDNQLKTVLFLKNDLRCVVVWRWAGSGTRVFGRVRSGHREPRWRAQGNSIDHRCDKFPPTHLHRV